MTTNSGVKYRLQGLNALPTISHHSEYGHLKIQTRLSKVYLDMDKQVKIRKLIDGNWILTNQYQAD